MKINLDEEIKNLDGTTYKENGDPITVGRVLSSCLDNGQAEGRMKLFVLAKRCYEGGSAEFDQADISLMKRIVETSKITSNVVIGQTLLLLDGTSNS